MLCTTVTVNVNDADEAIAFLNYVNQLTYIDIKSIVVKEETNDRMQ